MSHPPFVDRREVLRLGAGALGLLGFPGLAGAITKSTITVLYRRDLESDAPRVDAAALAAQSALESEFGQQRMRVLKPTAQALEWMDKGASTSVNFDADAGLFLMFSVARFSRRLPGGEMSMAEVRIKSKLYFGPSILAAGAEAEGVGRMAFGVASPEAEERGLEKAAQAAAKASVAKLFARLQAMGEAEMETLGRPIAQVLPSGQVVAVARPPQGTPAVLPALTKPARRHALIVGVSDYSRVNARLAGRYRMENLDGVRVDVQRLEGSFRQMGYEPKDIQVLLDAQATSSGIRTSLMKLAAKVSAEDLVCVTLSAHGAPADLSLSGYGLPVLDDWSGEGDGNALDFWQIQALIGHLPALQTVLIVDTCHSGGAATKMAQLIIGASTAPKMQTGTVTPEPARMVTDMDGQARHYAVIAAAQPDQQSLEIQPDGGVFTSQFVQALQASQGKVSLGEMFSRRLEPQIRAKVATACKGRADCRQNPVFAYAGLGKDIIL